MQQTDDTNRQDITPETKEMISEPEVVADNANDDDLVSTDTAYDYESKLVKLQQKIDELNDMYIRSQAEVQNIQRRSQDEIKKARDYAISSFAKDIIVVKDYLEMALKDQSNNFEAIKTGVDLTLKQLVQVFERQLIKEIEPKLNDKLDPNLHQAISTEEAEGQDSNTVIRVMQKGYMLNSRVIRPAMVVVAK